MVEERGKKRDVRVRGSPEAFIVFMCKKGREN